MPTVSDDTDRHQAVHLEHLSPTWVKWFDNEVGELKKRNGGYAEFNGTLRHGKMGPMRLLISFIEDQWRRDNQPFDTNQPA